MRLLIALTFSFFLLTSFNKEEVAVSFYEGSFKEMQTKAKASNKPYLIDFYTVWCSPCKNMEKFTFSNKELAKYLKDNYFAMKIDAESLMDDGADLAIKYDVRFFPTMIIVSPKGEVLKRFSGFQSADALLTELKKYRNANPAPASEIAKLDGVTNSNSVVNTSPAPTPLPSYSSGEGLFKISVSRQESGGFGVQLGVYGDYANVMKESQKLDDAYHKNILVNISKSADKNVFKLILGPFSSKEQADTYSKELKAKEGRNGMVVDLGKAGNANAAPQNSAAALIIDEGRGISTVNQRKAAPIVAKKK